MYLIDYNKVVWETTTTTNYVPNQISLFYLGDWDALFGYISCKHDVFASPCDRVNLWVAISYFSTFSLKNIARWSDN